MHLLSPLLLFFALEASTTPLPNPRPRLPSRQGNEYPGGINDYVPPPPDLVELHRWVSEADRACKELWDPSWSTFYDTSPSYNKCFDDCLAHHPRHNATSKSKSVTRSVRAHPKSLRLKPQGGPGNIDGYVPVPSALYEWARSLNEADRACKELWDPAWSTFDDISPSYNKCFDDYLDHHPRPNSTFKSKSVTRSMRAHPNSLDPRFIDISHYDNPLVLPPDTGAIFEHPELFQAYDKAALACNKLKDPGEAWLAEDSPYQRCFLDHMGLPLTPNGET